MPRTFARILPPFVIFCLGVLFRQLFSPGGPSSLRTGIGKKAERRPLQACLGDLSTSSVAFCLGSSFEVGDRFTSIATSSPRLLLTGGAGNTRRRRTTFFRGSSPASSPSWNDGVVGRGSSQELLDLWRQLRPEIKQNLIAASTALSTAIVLRTFVVEPRYIPSASMNPAFKVGDQLIVDKWFWRWRELQRRDVVVFRPPLSCQKAIGPNREIGVMIKRVVAVAGDTVEVKNGGRLYVNGKEQDEHFVKDFATYHMELRTVPAGHVFVLGDNRNDSVDGHVWGFLPKDNIIGRAAFKTWPPWRVGKIPAAPP